MIKTHAESKRTIVKDHFFYKEIITIIEVAGVDKMKPYHNAQRNQRIQLNWGRVFIGIALTIIIFLVLFSF
jgi:hypothetical protein